MIALLSTSSFFAAAAVLCMLLSSGLCVLGLWAMHHEIRQLTEFQPSLLA